MVQNNIRELLSKHPVIPVVNFEHIEQVEKTIRHLIEKNINCIEITLRNNDAFKCIEHAKSMNLPNFEIGVGTIISNEQITNCKDLNVDFMVSPGLVEELASAFEESNIPFIPGVSTPSDIIRGTQQSWDTFKFFPAHLFGGINALKTYEQVFPDLRFCPTGGVSETTFNDYLNLKNVIAVGGSWLSK